MGECRESVGDHQLLAIHTSARPWLDPAACPALCPSTPLLLQKLNHRIEVPRSVPGLVTDRLLVMSFLEGVPITRLDRHTQKCGVRSEE